MTIRIPANAVDPAGVDVEVPARLLLQSLNLLPSDEDLKNAGGVAAAFTGPPDSVGVLEAGATAASKWWASAMAAGTVISSGTLIGVWDSLKTSSSWNQPFALAGLGVIIASAIWGIAFLLSSDVRGRAAATVATIEARQRIATTMLDLAVTSYSASATTDSPLLALAGYPASNTAQYGSLAESGWKVIALKEGGDGRQYLLVKGGESEWQPSKNVIFD